VCFPLVKRLSATFERQKSDVRALCLEAALGFRNGTHPASGHHSCGREKPPQADRISVAPLLPTPVHPCCRPARRKEPVAATTPSRTLAARLARVRMAVRATWAIVKWGTGAQCARRAHSAAGAVQERGRFLVTWMTCSQDHLEHAVTDEQASLVIRTGKGIYLAVCAHEIVPRALVAPPGPRCARCEAICAEESRSRAFALLR